MSTISPRLLLRLLPVLLAVLFAVPPAAAESWTYPDAPIAATDNSVQPPKQADQTTRRPRHTASLEEFFEIDDDAEQYFKPQPLLTARRVDPPRVVAESVTRFWREALPTHRACAAYPTGPPHA
jgi:hypothetical protein